MAFGQLSDVGLRRLATEAEEHPDARYAPLLKEILENRAPFQLHPFSRYSNPVDSLLGARHLHFPDRVCSQQPGSVHFAGFGFGAGRYLSPVHSTDDRAA